jgi:hypothetical protein
MRSVKHRLALLVVVAIAGTIPGHVPSAAGSTAAAEDIGPQQVCSAPSTFGIGLVQSKWGSQPTTNFEAVFPRAGGGLTHYYR